MTKKTAIMAKKRKKGRRLIKRGNYSIFWIEDKIKALSLFVFVPISFFGAGGRSDGFIFDIEISIGMQY